MDKVTKCYDKDGRYIGLSHEHGKPENRRDESSGSGHSSSGSGGGGAGCVIAIIIAIVVFLLLFIALIVGLGGNATGHWGFMLGLLKIVWGIIKLPFVIAWFIIKVILTIVDKITIPVLLILALIGGAIAIISGNKKNKKG